MVNCAELCVMAHGPNNQSACRGCGDCQTSVAHEMALGELGPCKQPPWRTQKPVSGWHGPREELPGPPFEPTIPQGELPAHPAHPPSLGESFPGPTLRTHHELPVEGLLDVLPLLAHPGVHRQLGQQLVLPGKDVHCQAALQLRDHLVALQGEQPPSGPGHVNLWDLEDLQKETHRRYWSANGSCFPSLFGGLY